MITILHCCGSSFMCLSLYLFIIVLYAPRLIFFLGPKTNSIFIPPAVHTFLGKGETSFFSFCEKMPSASRAESMPNDKKEREREKIRKAEKVSVCIAY